MNTLPNAQGPDTPVIDNFDDLPPIPPPHPSNNQRSTYNPMLCRQIFKTLIAEPDIELSAVTNSLGVHQRTFYNWIHGLSGLFLIYKRVMAARSVGQVQAVKRKQLEIARDADDVSPQDVGSMRKIDLKSRIWATIDRGAQWRAAKWNPELFGDKQTIDLNVGLQPGEARRQAWAANIEARQAREVPAEVRDVSQSTQGDE